MVIKNLIKIMSSFESFNEIKSYRKRSYCNIFETCKFILISLLLILSFGQLCFLFLITGTQSNQANIIYNQKTIIDNQAIINNNQKITICNQNIILYDLCLTHNAFGLHDCSSFKDNLCN